MRELSARTRAEMYRGGASVGKDAAAVDRGIALAQAWSLVGDFETKMQALYPSKHPQAKAMVWQDGDVLMVEPFIHRSGRKDLVLTREPIGVFPSDTLLAQIMLLLG